MVEVTAQSSEAWNVDPEMAAVIQELSSTISAGEKGLTVDAMRCRDAEMLRRLPRMKVSEVHDHIVSLPGRALRLRVFHGGSEDRTGVVYFHGGGKVTGSIDTHDAICRFLAADSARSMIAVDYRLAPEVPFPGAVDDAYEATCWIGDHWQELGLDDPRLTVMGDSAGGSLAVATAIRIRDEGGPDLSSQILVYPSVDTSFEWPSFRRFGRGFLLDVELIRTIRRLYLQNEADWENPWAAPIGADLSALPPTFIQLAELDPLHDEGREFGARLRRAGVSVEVVEYSGLTHGFYEFFDRVAMARSAMREAASVIQRHSNPARR